MREFCGCLLSLGEIFCMRSILKETLLKFLCSKHVPFVLILTLPALFVFKQLVCKRVKCQFAEG